MILRAFIVATAILCGLVRAAQPASLHGQWRFALDSSDAGVNEQWFSRDLPDRIQLPGALQYQGFGERPSGDTKWTAGIGAALLKQPKYAPYRNADGFKTPFWLTPPRRYVGPAWYQRDVQIPAEWANQRIVLHLERPHWETAVFVDDKPMGTRDGLGMAHEYDLTSALTPGTHRLTIRVDNRVRIPVGVDAHSVSDQTQGNWNGIVGRIELRTTGRIWIDNVQVYPNIAERKARIRVQLGNLTGQEGTGIIRVNESSYRAQWDASSGSVEFDHPLGADALPWDEYAPNLQRLAVELQNQQGQVLDSRAVTFGLRELGIDGTQFTINGRKIFLRGTLECCIHPLTGYPPTDLAYWKRILTIARAHGLNHIRFHSWCPPEAAFVAADEMGFYLQVEASCWAGFGDDTPLDKWIYEEADRMIRAYGNHPSFILMAPTNEPHGKNRDKFLAQWVAHYSKKDPRRRYTAGAGWPQLAENNFHVYQPPRLQGTKALEKSPNTTLDYRQIIAQFNVPVVSHEIGQWCVYPNFDEIAKYTGHLKATNLEIFRDFLNNAGMGHQARDFLMASGRFQALLYKEEIEAALRTPGMAGIQLLDLHDFPGQGTAPVGVLDAFWDQKGYITPEQYRRFCNDTVPLARMTKRSFENNETFSAQIDVAHYGPRDLPDATATWRIRTSTGKVIGQGELASRTIPTGALTTLGNISLPLAQIDRAARLNLEITVADRSNDWHFWVFPAGREVAPPGDVLIATTLDDAAMARLDTGGKVLLLPGVGRIAADTLGSFQPIFWNRVTFPRQREHTLGVLVDPRHPALADFPTDNHSDWQWWDLQQNSRPMVLDALPRNLTPIVQMIDDWNVCRRLGLVIEAQVGNGRLVLSSIDLQKDLDQRPAARQMLRSILSYMSGEDFKPTVKLEANQVRSLLREPGVAINARVASASSEHADFPASNILDGDVTTIWHTDYGANMPHYPHEVVIELPKARRIAGVVLTPRQDGNRNGWIRRYAIHVSLDGRTWGEPIASGELEQNDDRKLIRFGTPAEAKFIRLIAVAGLPNHPWASLAELEILSE